MRIFLNAWRTNALLPTPNRGGGKSQADFAHASDWRSRWAWALGLSIAYLTVAIPLWKHPAVQLSLLEARPSPQDDKPAVISEGCSSTENRLSEQEVREILQANRKSVAQEVSQ